MGRETKAIEFNEWSYYLNSLWYIFAQSALKMLSLALHVMRILLQDNKIDILT